MTLEEKIVLMHDYLDLSFRQIGRAFDISHETARTIYKKFCPRFSLAEVMEVLRRA